MKLYYSPGVCSLSPHITVRELGLAVEMVKVDIHSHTTADGTNFYDINPRGYVPVLEFEDGMRMSEGPAIVQYLADLKPELGLAPPNGTRERYQLQEWLAFINSELHKGFAPLFDPAVPSDTKAAARAKLGKRFGWLAAQLEGQDYLMGSRFTVADAYLFTVLNWTGFVGLDLAAWPVLSAYRSAVAQRPSVQAALKAEGLIK